MAELLDSPCSEILLNFDADGIGRIFQAQESANHEEVLSTIFGDGSWSQVFKKHYTNSRLCEESLALYKQKLRSLPDVKYVYPFEMRSASGSLNYYLLFASKHFLRLEKMKEAMKGIDQDGSYRFSDASVGQTATFRFDDPTQFSPQLHARYQGQTVPYEQLRDYTLNETPFITPSKMLNELEKQGLILKVNYIGMRKEFAFAPGKTIDVTFASNQTGIQYGLQF